MPQLNATSVNCVYGAGAPSISAPEGTRYIDTTAGAEYEFSGGGWNALGGGGGAGLPYTDNAGYWSVYAPYAFYLYCLSQPTTNIGIFYNGVGGTGAFFRADNLEIGGSITTILASNLTLLAIPLVPGASGTIWNNAGIVTVVP